MSISVTEAYASAEAITKDQARNFYYGIRLLTRRKRSALCALYALSRRVDDIGDGDLPVPVKLEQLAVVRSDVQALQAGAVRQDPVLLAVAHAATEFDIPLAAFGELVDGVEMDVAGRTYDTFEDLVDYCRCVAGSIGRLCLGVFGNSGDPQAPVYANTLGIALQQTNILRDIREDLRNGRVYLPAEDLDRFGVKLALGSDGALLDEGGQLSELIRFATDRARGWYDDGLQLIPLLDRRSAACCRAMSGIYQRLLEEMAATPSLVFDRRLSLSGKDKLFVAARALAGRSGRSR